MFSGTSSTNGRYTQSFPVRFEYPIHFTRGLFSPDNPLLSELMEHLRDEPLQRMVVYVDEGVSIHHPGLISDIIRYMDSRVSHTCLATAPLIMPGGEKTKNGWDNVFTLIHHLAENRIDRHNLVMAIGGGAFLDMAGVAAALVHRGLRLIRVPTTTLAQNDAGIGVKNGINHENQKNFLGTFCPPFAVINDALFLQTLSLDQWIGGLSEAFKVAIIKDAGFFNFLCKNADPLKNRDLSVMEKVIYHCALLHLEHIRTNGDPFEFGSARPLDFGHWSAHELESLSGYQIGHGPAVAVGIALDSYLAAHMGLISQIELDAILRGLTACGLPVYSPILAQRSNNGRLLILDGIDRFREHLGGELTITLPKGIGTKVEVHELSESAIEDAVNYLKSHEGQTI